MALYGGPQVTPRSRPVLVDRGEGEPYVSSIDPSRGTSGGRDPDIHDIPARWEDYQGRLGNDLYHEQQVQGRRRRYYEDREADADRDYDAAYDDYRSGMGDLDREARAGYDEYEDTVAEPVDAGYGAYRAGQGALYGATDDIDLSQYGDKSYYLPGASADRIDPTSDLGRTLEEKDYGALYGQFAGAANAQLTDRIKNAVGDLESTAAGAGRLDSTLFSRDAGSVFQSLAADSRAELSRGALEAASLTQRDREGRRSGILDYMNLNRTSASRAGEAAASAAGEAAALRQRNRESSRRAYETDRDVGEDRYRNRREFSYGEHRDSVADVKDAQRFRAGIYTDTYNAGAGRSNEAYGRAEDQRTSYRDLASGNYDRATSKVNAKNQRKDNLINSVIHTAGNVVAGAL